LEAPHAHTKSKLFEGLAAHAETEEDEYEQNITQIDQLSDLIFYYENMMGRNNLHFETNGKTIIENFILYLKQYYEKVFAETLLFQIFKASQSEAGDTDQSTLERQDIKEEDF